MDTTIIGAIIAAVSAIIAAIIGFWAVKKYQGAKAPEPLWQLFLLGANLAKFSYHKMLSSTSESEAQTLKVLILDGLEHLNLPDSTATQIKAFLKSTSSLQQEFPELRNRLTLSINQAVSPKAATAFYLGCNIISVHLTCEIASLGSEEQKVLFIPSVQSLLAEIIRDAKTLGLKTKKLSLLETHRLISQQSYINKLGAESLNFGLECEKKLSG